MNFNYNGNLSIEQRVEDASKDIMLRYPEITKENAKRIALLEGPISTKITDEMIFRRLYNIMVVYFNNKPLQYKIFCDMKDIYIIDKNPKIDSLMDRLIDYINGIGDFPTF